ncbi:UNVERIFIED_CONTAM: protein DETOXIFICATION 21 [Sesamum radiatum]|uniref:Protein DETOXIFICATION 21 n=1 Tax=Sesamum radiatum TaxID=300843 RepID=A0AAW2LKY1_SESRA
MQLGMANGLETLCGQAYGARQYHMLGIYLQRSWLVSVIASTVLLPIFIFTTPILKAIGQADEIAEMAGTMALWLIPVIYSFIVSYTCQLKYKLGVSGAMISTVLAFWLPNIGQVVFIISGGCPETWRGFSTLAFKDLWPIFKLSLSAGAMLCLEVWYNTVLILLTGNMKNAEVAIDALSICLNINGWEMMISLGFMAAASVRIANELGSGTLKCKVFNHHDRGNIIRHRICVVCVLPVISGAYSLSIHRKQRCGFISWSLIASLGFLHTPQQCSTGSGNPTVNTILLFSENIIGITPPQYIYMMG